MRRTELRNGSKPRKGLRPPEGTAAGRLAGGADVPRRREATESGERVAIPHFRLGEGAGEAWETRGVRREGMGRPRIHTTDVWILGAKRKTPIGTWERLGAFYVAHENVLSPAPGCVSALKLSSCFLKRALLGFPTRARPRARLPPTPPPPPRDAAARRPLEIHRRLSGNRRPLSFLPFSDVRELKAPGPRRTWRVRN